MCDSNADSNIECLLSEDGFEIEDDEALEFEPAYSHLTGDDDNDPALEAALGLDYTICEHIFFVKDVLKEHCSFNNIVLASSVKPLRVLNQPSSTYA